MAKGQSKGRGPKPDETSANGDAATLPDTTPAALTSRPLRAVSRWLGPLAGLLLGAAVLWPALFGAKAFFPADMWYRFYPASLNRPAGIDEFPGNPLFGDMAFYVGPAMWVARESMRRGDLPLWNPYFRAGEPLLGGGVSGPFSPLNLPVNLLEWPNGFAWSMLLKTAVLWMGAWLLARAWGLGGGAAALLALGFAFAPSYLSHLHQPIPAVLVWFPWMLWSVERAARCGPGWAACVAGAWPAALFACAALLGGHPHSAFNVLFASSVYAVVRLPWCPAAGALRRRIVWAVMVALGLVIAAPAAWPFLEFLGSSSTLTERATAHGRWHVEHESLWTYWNPMLFGSHLPAQQAEWSGKSNWCEEQQYVGVLPWLLAMAGLAMAWRAGRGAWLIVAGIVAMAVPCVVLGYGVRPLNLWLTGYPPFSFNSNARLGYICQAALVMAAALASASLLRRHLVAGAASGAISRARLAAFVVVAAVCVAAAAWLFAEGWRRQWDGRPWLALAVAAMAVAAHFLAGSRRTALAAQALLPMVFLADTAPVWRGFHPLVPAEWCVPKATGPFQPGKWPPDITRRAASEDMAAANMYALYGWTDLRAYANPVAARHALYMTRVAELPQPDIVTNRHLQNPATLAAFARMGAPLLATTNVYPDEYLRRGLELASEQGPFRLYTFTEAAPFALWVPSRAVAKVPGMEAAAGRLRAAIQTATEPIVVETDSGHDEASTAPVMARVGQLRYDSANSLALDLGPGLPAEDGYAVLRVSYDTGWRAEAGGRPLRVVPAQLKFMAVEVPAGVRNVSLQFMPAGFVRGCIVATIAAALLAACLAAAWAAGRRAAPAPATKTPDTA